MCVHAVLRTLLPPLQLCGILCLSVLPCSVCGIGTLPCSVLLKTPCSYSCGSMTLWGWHTSSRIVSRCSVP